MAKFEVQFSAPLLSAQMANENCIVGVDSVSGKESAPAPHAEFPAQKSPEQPPASVVAPHLSTADQTIDSIKPALEKAVAELSSQRGLLESLAASYAVEVARVFLGSTDELIEQRLQQNVLHVLQHPDAIIVKLFVHSTCHESIKRWLDDNDDLRVPDLGIEVMKDDSLQPGDCRADFGRSGRLAALEEQLKLVESRLRESIRDNKSGADG